MLKGFCMFFMTATLFAVSQDLSAQVYRCETPGGVVYADMPCGESAEEIQIDVVEPPSSGSVGTDNADADLAAAESNLAAGDQEPAAKEAQTLSDFSKMLEAQRETQISEIDRSLSGLKAQVAGESFASSDQETRVRLIAEIKRLESARASILDQYESMIAEARRRTE